MQDKIYEIMKQNNLEAGITLFPMLRKGNDKLLLGSLIEEILNKYKNTSNINIDKMKLASQILESYYGEYCGIKYFFNV